MPRNVYGKPNGFVNTAANRFVNAVANGFFMSMVMSMSNEYVKVVSYCM